MILRVRGTALKLLARYGRNCWHVHRLATSETLPGKWLFKRYDLGGVPEGRYTARMDAGQCASRPVFY